MRKIYHLGTCSTCVRIIKELNPSDDFILQDIKTEKMSEAQVDEMKEMAGSYDAIFSRRSMKYKALKLNEKNLSEEEIRNYILDEYTFLKRPVIIVDEKIFVGNSKKVIEAANAFING